MLAPPASLLGLPTELRLTILRNLIPIDKEITIYRDPCCREKEIYHGGYAGQLGICVAPSALHLLQTCRQLYHDVLALLYGRNSYSLVIGTQWSEPLRLNPLDHFSPEGLRLIKRLNVEVQEDLVWANKFHAVKHRLEKLVKALSHRHALLHLSLSTRAFGPHELHFICCSAGRPRCRIGPDPRRWQYVLEPLASLRVAEAHIHNIDSPFAEDLAYVITTKDRPLLELVHYADEEYRVRKLRSGSRAKPREWTTCTRTTKKFWQPVYDWDAMAISQDVDVSNLDGETGAT